MSILARLVDFLPQEDKDAIAAARQTGPSAVAAGPATMANDRPSEVEVEAIADSYVAEQAAAAEAVVPPAVIETPVEEPLITEDTETVVTSNNVTSDETVVENGRLLVYSITRDANGNVVSRTFLKDLGATGGGGSSSGGGEAPPVPGDPVEKFNVKEFAQANYGFLGQELLDLFIDEYNVNGGDADEALRGMRTTQAYKDRFPGIFREDGTTLRIESNTPELDYIKIKEDYRTYLEDYNLNPDYFENQITELFTNDVDPSTFANRLDTAYTSLFTQFDAVKQYYVQNYPGIFPSTDDLTDEAIFASFISEDISSDIIEQRVKVSQIGGAFGEEDLTISADQAQRLVSAGLSGTGAQQIAQRAEARLPRLQRLAKRFTGREDIFGLSEFIESEVFGEGTAAQLEERLESEQASVFTRAEGAAATQAGVTGLVEQ
ncbi:hypothetical protein [uncultured Mediterranean phage uvMED]|nr:hypothetical protein [uncultured Mediterranean phage uvMED]